MPESEREVDFELIAAFIDGRLSGEERRRVVALLARSQAAFEVYTEALGVRTDLEGEAVVPIVPGRRRRGPGGWWAMAPLAAAAVLLVAIFPLVQRQRNAQAFGAPAIEIASTLVDNPAVARRVVGDLDERRWSPTRGGESRLVDTIAAFRLGVRAVDLQVALSAGDMDVASRLTDEMLTRLAAVPGLDFAHAHYVGLRELISSRAPRDSLVARATRAEHETGEFLGTPWFSFGKWFAAGELAARTHMASFFVSRETARVLGADIEREHLAPDDVALLRQVAARSGQRMSADDFDAIQQTFQQLIRRHAE